MSDINDVLERLISDPAFRRALSDDPAKALEGYELSDADREVLASQVSSDSGAAGGLEQRTSKSALAGLFGGGGSAESDLDFIGRHTEHGDTDSPLEEEIGFAYKKISFGDGESLTQSPQDPTGGDAGEMPIESMSLNFGEVREGEGESLAAPTSDPGYSELQSDSYLKVSDIKGESVQEGGGHLPADMQAGDPSEDASSGWPVKWEGPSLTADSSAPDSDHQGGMNVQFGKSEPQDPGDISSGIEDEKATFKEFTVTKKSDMAGELGAGGDLAPVELAGTESEAANAYLKLEPESGEDQADAYLEIEMKPVFITSYDPGPSGDAAAESAGSTEESSGATSNKPKEIVVVGSKPKADVDEIGDLGNGSGRVEEIEDGTSKTAMVSESTSGSDGDPLVGKITPKGTDTDEADGMSSPYLKQAAFQNTSPEDPLEVVGGEAAGPGSEPAGHDGQMDIHSFNWGEDQDPDRPIVAASVYNPDDSTTEAEGVEIGALKAGSTDPADSATAPDLEAADSDSSRSSSGGKSAGAGLRSDGELVQDGGAPGNLAPAGRGVEEGIEGTDVSTGYTSEPGDIGDDLPDDPPED